MKVTFRMVCPHCGIDLHTCTNCRYYMPGKPNDCAVPGTEFIRDREAANFCEDFKVKIDSPDRNQDKKKFDSLFKKDD
ncbi:MAG TPA: hypothetical protein VLF94_01460 [Chlamydiales bacterium]|nr:hypothetical protein [Chlamydiales bacterium]